LAASKSNVCLWHRAEEPALRSYIADYLTRFQSPAGEMVVPMPAIIGSGARPD
jgi:hypothetical protein